MTDFIKNNDLANCAESPEGAANRHGHLFKSPIAWAPKHLRDLARYAERNFSEWEPILAEEPTLPASELRANIARLLPAVRLSLQEIEPIENVNYSLPSFGEADAAERRGPRAQVPPIFAHFGVMALALFDAERKAGASPEAVARPISGEDAEANPDRFDADLTALRRGDCPGPINSAVESLVAFTLQMTYPNWQDCNEAEDLAAQAAAVRLLRGVTEELARIVDRNYNHMKSYHEEALRRIDGQRAKGGL
jgi:hypothetical protein